MVEMESLMVNIRSAIKMMLPGHLPDFLIIGAQKSATTSLHYYLNQHPQLIGSRPKEVCYFDRDENFEKGVNWYKKNFPNTKLFLRSYKYFEATPEYLYRKCVPARIFEFNPAIKLVIILRNPVQRAFSAWCMYKAFSERSKLPKSMYRAYVKNGELNMLNEFYSESGFPDFETTVEYDIQRFISYDPREEPSIVRRGLYYHQIKRFIDLFGMNSILILGFQDIVGSKKIVALNKILEFIELPPSDWCFLKDNPKNKYERTEHLPSGVGKKLELFYGPFNEKLFDLIGFKPNW